MSYTIAHEMGHVTWRKWLVLALLMMLVIVSFIDRTIISLLVDPIREDLNISDVEIGLLQGLGFGLFYAAATIPAGWLVDRFSRRTVLASGFIFWTFAAAACGLARNYTQLFLARMGVGMGEATLSPAAYSLLGDLFRRDQLALAISIYAAGAAIGAGIAFGVGGIVISMVMEMGNVTLPLLGELRPWQLAFVLTALPSLPLVVFVLILREPQRVAPRSDMAGWSEVFAFLKFRRTYLTCHFAGFSLLSAAAFGAGAWMPTYLMRHFDLKVGTVGASIGVVSALTGLVGTVSAGAIVDRMFRSGMNDAHFRYFLITCPLMMIGTVIAFWSMSNVTAALIMWGALHFLYPFGGIAPAHLQIVTPRHLRGRVSALYILSFNFCGLAIGPALVALLAEYVFRSPESIGKAIALNFCILLPLVMAIFAYNLRHARTAVEEADAGG